MSQKTLNLCLERYNFVKFGETTKSSHTVLCINNAYSVNSEKYRVTPTAIASKHGDGYVFTLNYDFDRPLFTIVQKSYTLDGTSGNIVFEGIDPISKGGSKYLRKVTVSPVKLSDGSYLLEVTNDEYLRIGTTGAALGDEDLESLNEKIVAMGGIEKSVETVGGKQVLKLDASGSTGAKEIVYFDVDPSNPPSGIYDDITVALSNDKEPVIKIDGAVYFYTATGTDKYVFVGGYTKEAVGYTEIEVSDDDSVTSKSVDDKVFNMYMLYRTDPASPGDPPGTGDQPGAGYWICDENKHVITKAELLAAHADCRYFVLNNDIEPGSNTRKYFASVTVISNSNIRILFSMIQTDDGSAAEFTEKLVMADSEGRLYVLRSYETHLAGTNQAVLVSEPQSFDAAHKAQGRANIGAASASDVTALQSQVSSLSDVSAYSVKGEATVAQLNAGPSGIQAGWAYQLTDSGTLTDGSLAVVAGDTVAWDGTKWFPLVRSDYYATKTYTQNVAHSIAPEFDQEVVYPFGTLALNNGCLCQFVVEHSGAWSSSHAVSTEVEDAFKFGTLGVVCGFYLYTTGDFRHDKAWGVTDLIPVETGDVIEWSIGTVDSSKALGLYDVNKDFLSYYSSNSNPRTVTLTNTSIKYVRLCVNLEKLEKTYIKVNGTVVWRYIPEKNPENEKVIGFIGEGSSYVETKYFGKFLRGRTYKVTMLTESWTSPGGVSDYKFLIAAYHKNGDRAVGYCKVFGNEDLDKRYYFTVEDTDNVEYVAIGGRATAGTKVEALVEDITGMDEMRNLVLPEFVNSSRTGLLPDLDNDPTRVTGTSVIVVPYEGLKVWIKGPTNMAALISQGNAAAVATIIPALNRMPLSFSFSPATKCYNIQFAKYSSGGPITEPLSASDVNQMLSDGRIQITYEPKDKGVEERNSAQITSVKAAQRKLAANTDNNYLGTAAVFAHISDLHGDGQRLKNAFDFCEKIGAVDGLICSGDSVMYRHQEGSSWQNKMQSGYSLPFLFCIGNHESWPTGQTKLFEDNIEPLVDKNGYLEASGTDTTHCYWYRDFDSKKIRVIAVNYYEGGVYNGCLGQAQLDWFVATLSDTPDGYGVLVIIHSPEDKVVAPVEYSTFHQNVRRHSYQENGFYVGNRPVMQLVDAFIGRTSASISYTESTGESVSVSADFSGVDASTEFIAYVDGHRHNDWIGYYAHSTYRQLSLGVTCGIGIYGDSNNRAWCNESDLPRGGVGPTQDAFNIYGIDRENGVVKVVRVGSDITESLVPRERMEIPYRDLTTTIADKTLRFKFSDNSFDPNGAGVGSSGVWEKRTEPEFKAIGNVWDWTCMDTSWSGAFKNSFQDDTNEVDVIAGNTAGIVNVNELFSSCSSLKSVVLLDFSSVTSAARAFNGCTALSSIPLFDTSSIANMAYMFLNCDLVAGGALALYTQASTQTAPPTYFSDAFKNCGKDTVTGAAELAQIPSSWGGLAEE